jgi:hypothetical protein
MSTYAGKRSNTSDLGPTTAHSHAATPGKQTLVEQAYTPTVQLRADAAGASETSAVHAAAARGVATSSSSLPYGDVIQRAFGRHDISSVQAHTGSEAAASANAMGAQGYATGNHVVLGGAADLHTAAHEVAHVVQQRGGVQLKGGVGEVGDPYERHADAVADAVVQGKSAEGLLDVYAGGGTSASASSAVAQPVQGYFRITQADFAAKNVGASAETSFSGQEPVAGGESYLKNDGATNIVAETIATVGGLRVSGDGKLAIEDGGDRQAKTFFIEEGLIGDANEQLKKVGSTYRLLKAGGTLTVPDSKAKLHTLVQVVAQNDKSQNKSSGDNVNGPVNCDEMAGAVAGWGADYNRSPQLQGVSDPGWMNEEGHRVAAYVVEYAKAPNWKEKILKNRKKRAAEASNYGLPPNLNTPAAILLALNPKRNEIAEAYAKMSPGDKAKVAEDLGINEGSNPNIGESFVVFSTGAKDKETGRVKDHESGNDVAAKWGQHWGGVVAKSGGDYITLENYDRKSEDAGRTGASAAGETRAFFQMYGSDTGQTWHDIQKATGEFPNAISLVYGKKGMK